MRIPVASHLCLQLEGAQGLEVSSTLLRLLNGFQAFGVAGGPTETMLDILADLWSPEAIRIAF
jgi:hypothetical protein